MNVRSMHIEVQQSTQQVAANLGRKWLPEEIDWVLNKMQERFIRSHLQLRADGSGGYDLDMAKATGIQPLITYSEAKPYIVSDGYEASLPPNLMYLFSDMAYTVCDTSPTVVALTEHIMRILAKETTKADAPFYQTVTLDINGTLVRLPNELPAGHAYTGYPSKKDLDMFVGWMALKQGVYWERYRDLYYPGHFLKVATSAPTGQWLADALVTENGTVETKSFTYHTSTKEGRYRANRLTSGHLIASMQSSPHYCSHHRSPVSELLPGRLKVYKGTNFTVTGVKFGYIRKPQPISLSLNTDCELTASAQAICDLATEYLKGRTNDQQGKVLATEDIRERVTL